MTLGEVKTHILSYPCHAGYFYVLHCSQVYIKSFKIFQLLA